MSARNLHLSLFFSPFSEVSPFLFPTPLSCRVCPSFRRLSCGCMRLGHGKKLNNKKTKKKFEKSVRVSSGQGPGLNESSFGLCLLAAAVG